MALTEVMVLTEVIDSGSKINLLKKNMKNYKTILLILILVFFILFLFFYLKSISWLSNDNASSWSVDKLNNNTVKTELEIECKKILDWSDSELVSEIWPHLLNNYKKAKSISDNLSTNSYLAFNYIKNWDCEKFDTQKNKDFCNNIKNWKTSWIEWEYEYYFSKSIIDWETNCDELKVEREKNDCKNNFLYFQNLDKKIEKDNILEMSSIEMSKTYNDLEESKYFKKLNEDFMNLCLKLPIEWTYMKN